MDIATVVSQLTELQPWENIVFAPIQQRLQRSFKVHCLPAAINALLIEARYNPLTDELSATRFANDELKVLITTTLPQP